MQRTGIASPTEPTIVFNREFDAPRELVWQAWTDPKHIVHWWGPNGFTNTIHSMDVRPGGVWRFIMHGPDGTDYPNKIVYREVVKPERLVYDHTGDDNPDDPHSFQVRVTFTEDAGRTKVHMRMTFPSIDARNKVIEFGAVEGGAQTLDKLGEYIKDHLQ
jgi:uncharacterized protein YndB with AHSA1/START domain